MTAAVAVAVVERRADKNKPTEDEERRKNKRFGQCEWTWPVVFDHVAADIGSAQAPIWETGMRDATAWGPDRTRRERHVYFQSVHMM